MTAMEAAGMEQDMMIEDSSSAGDEAADVNRDVVGEDDGDAGMERVMLVFQKKLQTYIGTKVHLVHGAIKATP